MCSRLVEWLTHIALLALKKTEGQKIASRKYPKTFAETVTLFAEMLIRSGGVEKRSAVIDGRMDTLRILDV